MESSLLTLTLGNKKLILPRSCKLLTIGRSELANIIVNHPQVSRFHCYINFQDEKCNENEIALYDGSLYTGSPSLNGTFVSSGYKDRFQMIGSQEDNLSKGYIIEPNAKIRLGRENAPVLKLEFKEESVNSLVDWRHKHKEGYIKSLFGGLFKI
ncbi:MAG: FHA domain-containing protein [Candidatus Pacearchaeota archaeon]|jgi:pSer/pThr/pTyr-binding forkhead associated (FHA) protein